MILIDALYINNGGGKVLLDYLVEQLEATELSLCYLFDKRVEENPYTIKSSNKVYYKQASLITRNQFYRKHKKYFDKVLCFGNLAPLTRLSIPVFTYFHQRAFLSIPTDIPLKMYIGFYIKSRIFRYLLKNTDELWVQTPLMQEEIERKKIISSEKIKQLPFYRDEDLTEKFSKTKNSFIFASTGTPYKNHTRLINAFCSFYNKHRQGTLILTVDADKFPELAQLIDNRIAEGFPIKNIGFVDRKTLIEAYQCTEYHIFPSLAESFGLGIVEAIECGCKIIGADLPYMYEICEPSIVFDPLNEKAIEHAFQQAISKEERPTIQKISNKINELIQRLKS